MKTEHLLFFPEILKKEAGKITVRLEDLDEYQPEDFNVFLAVETLKACRLLSEEFEEKYETLKYNYLYNDVIQLPTISFQGELANRFTELEIEQEILREEPIYTAYSASLFNATNFGEEWPEKSEAVEEIENQLTEKRLMTHQIMTEISKQLGVTIKTTSWKRLPNGKFDYSLPATLTFEVYERKSELLTELEKIAKTVVNYFSIEAKMDEEWPFWKMVISGEF
jgi:hypothetical protein